MKYTFFSNLCCRIALQYVDTWIPWSLVLHVRRGEIILPEEYKESLSRILRNLSFLWQKRAKVFVMRKRKILEYESTGSHLFQLPRDCSLNLPPASYIPRGAEITQWKVTITLKCTEAVLILFMSNVETFFPVLVFLYYLWVKYFSSNFIVIRQVTFLSEIIED